MREDRQSNGKHNGHVTEWSSLVPDEHLDLFADQVEAFAKRARLGWDRSDGRAGGFETADQIRQALRAAEQQLFRQATHAELAVDIARRNRPPIRSYSTGHTALDHLIGGGWRTRQAHIVLGVPGAGKTAFVVSTARNASVHVPILYASTELESYEVVARFAAPLLPEPCPWSQIVCDGLREDVIAALEGRQIHVLGCETLPRDGNAALELIECEALKIAGASGVSPMIVIDYIQDLARGAERDLRARVGDLATHVRAMSQRLDGPIIAVSSVARGYYSPEKAGKLRELDDPSVYLAAAKESGDVDYAAAVVLFLDVDDDRGQAERDVRIAVAKSRPGRVGFATARFLGATSAWKEAVTPVGAATGQDRAALRREREQRADDAMVIDFLKKLAVEGKGELATFTYVRDNVGRDKPHTAHAIDRLKAAGYVQVELIERVEGGRKKKREVLVLAPGVEELPPSQGDLPF